MPTELGPHNMTSDVLPSPFVVTESGHGIPNNPFRAFDGVALNYWLSSIVSTGFIAIDLGSAGSAALGSYAIACPGAATTFMPSAFTLQGSNNGTTWTTLDTRASETGWTSSQTRTYTCNSPSGIPYRYYKLDVTANNGGSGVVVGELSLFAAPNDFAPHNMTSNTAPSPFVASASTGGASAFQAFDGAYTIGGGVSGNVGWLQLDTGIGAAHILTSYAIDAGGTAAPKTFTMQGSNDGSTWNILDTRTSETGWVSGSPRTYTCAVITTAYRYFRLDITATNGATSIIIGELYLYSALTAQTITFPVIATHATTDAPFALAATSDSGLAVTYTVTSGPATVSGSTLTLTGSAGTVVVAANQAGNGTYSAATPVSRTFSVLLGQTITFAVIPAHLTTDGPITLAATASSSLTVAYAITGPASLAGSVVTLTGSVGTVTITATQAGNGTYAAATAVVRSFAVTASVITERGGITYDQIRRADRSGPGSKFWMISAGSGSPNGVVTGSPGDLYVNTSGGAGTTLYVKESGTATTSGWVGK